MLLSGGRLSNFCPVVRLTSEIVRAGADNFEQIAAAPGSHQAPDFDPAFERLLLL